MAVPPFDADHPVAAQRLETLDDLGNAQVDRALFFVRCSTCGFRDWDQTFTAWPGRAHLSPSELSTFVSTVGAEAHQRKCPDCHGEARLDGMRVFIMAGTLGKDLIAEYEPRHQRTTFRLLGPNGLLEPSQPDGDALRTVCHDSMVRAGTFLAEVSPERRGDAEALLAAVADADPDRADAHIGLAKLAWADKDSDRALEHARRAASGARSDRDSCAGLGALLGEIALGQNEAALLDDAVGWYRKAIELAPEDRQLDLSLARLLVQSGSFQEATPHIERAQRASTTSVEARYLSGVMLLHQGRPKAAVDVFADLATDAPRDPSILHMLAWSHARIGDTSAAESSLQEAEALGPTAEEHAYFVDLVEEALEAAAGGPSGGGAHGAPG